jgi:hypothetical protein
MTVPMESLPNRPLTMAEVKKIREHERIESSLSMESASGEGIRNLLVLFDGTAWSLVFGADGWTKQVLEEDIDEETFVSKAQQLAAEFS